MPGLIAVASVKGAPGATTVAAGLAACWPGGPALLVEADPQGGDLAARFGHADTPGVASVAAAARHGTGPGWWDAHVQHLPIGVHALLGPAAPDAAVAAITALGPHAEALRGRIRPAILDVGRALPGSAAGPLLAAADVLLLVAWPQLDSLAHVAACLSALSTGARSRVRLVLAGPGDYPGGEIGRDLAVPVVATLPRERWGADVLAGRAPAGRSWRRLRLPRALHDLAGVLADRAPAHTGRLEIRGAGR